MQFPKRFQKKLSKPKTILQFFGRFRKKKRKKSNLKNEKQIRHRREELYEIREEWINDGDKDVEAIDGVLAEFHWILGEEKKQDSYSELLKAKRQIEKLEKRNRKLQVSINIMRGD